MRKRLVYVAVACLGLAACSGTTGETTTTAGGEGTTSTTEAPVETTTSQSEETTTLVAGAGGDDCLVGDWVLDDDAFFEELAAEFAGEEGFAELTVGDGEFSASFSADGKVSAVRQDWGFSVTSDDGTFTIRINGDQSGTWETDGSTLMLVLDGGSGFVTSTTVEVDGEEIALPTSPIDLPAESLSSTSEFSCGDETLVVSSDGFTSTFVRR